MARLIHLNGPSRVGKSTLARRFVDDHPGALLLDLDVLVGLVGGWQRDFSGSLEVAREHGRLLASAHLRSGHDVIVPQLVTVFDEGPDPAFEDTARAAGASYVQVALLVSDDEHLQRLQAKRPATEVEVKVQVRLKDPGGELLERIRDHLAQYLDARPHVARLDTTGLVADESYRRLDAFLDARIRH